MAKKKWTKKYKKKFKRSWKNAKKRVTKRWKKIKRLRNGKNFYKAVLSVLGKLPKNENIIVFESFLMNGA
jgi:CDP-glycerol glycerophosphotransferase